jgi:nicotinamidase-related amidase
MRTLVLVDLQNDFVSRLPEVVAARVVSGANELLAHFHRLGLPIVVVETERRADGSDSLPIARREGRLEAVAGTRGAETATGLELPPGHIRVVKTKYSAFFGTSLAEALSAEQTSLVVCGVNTHACVRATVVDAVQLDFDVVVAGDCTASYDREHHDESLRYFHQRLAPVLTNREILERAQ